MTHPSIQRLTEALAGFNLPLVADTEATGLGIPTVRGNRPRNDAVFFASGAPSMGGAGQGPQGHRRVPGIPTCSVAAHPFGIGEAVNQNRSGVRTMTNSISVFNFNSTEVRTIVKDGEPWFVAADVCSVLCIKNHRESIRHLDDDEKGVISNDTLGGTQKTSVVNESGLYALVLRSRKPEARKFAKWVTSEVLPAIRKTGKFETVTVNAENAPKKIAPPVISDYLQMHINRKTHEVALGQYESIRGIITEAVQGNLNCGASEATAHDYIDTFGSEASTVTVINTRDIFMLASATTQLLNSAGEALETIHRIEKRIGRNLYQRKEHGRFGCYGLPESLVESVISAAQERKAA